MYLCKEHQDDKKELPALWLAGQVTSVANY